MTAFLVSLQVTLPACAGAAAVTLSCLSAGSAGDGQDHARVLVRQWGRPADGAAHQEDAVATQSTGGDQDVTLGLPRGNAVTRPHWSGCEEDQLFYLTGGTEGYCCLLVLIGTSLGRIFVDVLSSCVGSFLCTMSLFPGFFTKHLVVWSWFY